MEGIDTLPGALSKQEDLGGREEGAEQTPGVEKGALGAGGGVGSGLWSLYHSAQRFCASPTGHVKRMLPLGIGSVPPSSTLTQVGPGAPGPSIRRALLLPRRPPPAAQRPSPAAPAFRVPQTCPVCSLFLECPARPSMLLWNSGCLIQMSPLSSELVAGP